MKASEPVCSIKIRWKLLIVPGMHLNTGDFREPVQEAVSPMESEQDLKTICLHQPSQRSSELLSHCWQCVCGG